MGDQILQANVIRVTMIGANVWYARIGPATSGLSCVSRTPADAVRCLAALCEQVGWPWDDSWSERS